MTTKFAAYDADDPWSKIPGFLLNFDAYRIDEVDRRSRSSSAAQLVKSEDGRDRIFGDNGNDWIVGGTDCDWLFGGFGDDLLNLDDNLETNGGANDRTRGRRAVPRRRLRVRRRRPRRADREHGAGPHVRLARRVQQLHRPVRAVRAARPSTGSSRPTHASCMRELAYAAGVDVTLTPFEPFDEIGLIEPGDATVPRPDGRPARSAAGPHRRRPARRGRRQEPPLPVRAHAARPHLEVPLDDRRLAGARQRRGRHRPRDPPRHRHLLDVRGHERLRHHARDAERPAAAHADHRRLRHRRQRRRRLRPGPRLRRHERQRAPRRRRGVGLHLAGRRPLRREARPLHQHGDRRGPRRQRRPHRRHGREPPCRQHDRDHDQEGGQRRERAGADDR